MSDEFRPKGTVTVDCTHPECLWSFWVSCDDKRLPTGPFMCPEHDPNGKITMSCVRCPATIKSIPSAKEGSEEPGWLCKDCLAELLPEYDWSSVYTNEQIEKYEALILAFTQTAN